MNTERPKVFIIGCSGSGKTTLARQLAARFVIPHHELDFMAWDREGDGALLPYEERVQMAQDLATAEGWVVEGIYLGWTAPLMERADVIVWMDNPLRVALWRIFWRHVRAELRRNNQFPGWTRLFRFMRLVASQYRDRSTTFEPPDISIGPAAIAAELKPHTAKVVRGSGRDTLQRVIGTLEGGVLPEANPSS